MSINHWLKEFEMRKWAEDVTAYERWKTFRDKFKFEDTKAMAQRQMDRLQANWPNHPME